MYCSRFTALLLLAACLANPYYPAPKAAEKTPPGGPVRPPAITPIIPETVTIPAGCFRMGSLSLELHRNPDEKRHKVCLKSFELSTHEITVQEFEIFANATRYTTDAETNYRVPGCWSLDLNDHSSWSWDWRTQVNWKETYGQAAQASDPVTCVSFRDIGHYVVWLNDVSGHRYRLPTEAEWEYAARAKSNFLYYWGNNPGKSCLYANVADKTLQQRFPMPGSFACNDHYLFSSPVKSFLPNRFGLYDMLGNVWEWTCSAYGEDYAGQEQSCIAPSTLTDNDYIAVRGGGWNATADRLRSAYRNLERPWIRMQNWGFRLVRIE